MRRCVRVIFSVRVLNSQEKSETKARECFSGARTKLLVSLCWAMHPGKKARKARKQEKQEQRDSKWSHVACYSFRNWNQHGITLFRPWTVTHHLPLSTAFRNRGTTASSSRNYLHSPDLFLYKMASTSAAPSHFAREPRKRKPSTDPESPPSNKRSLEALTEVHHTPPLTNFQRR